MKVVFLFLGIVVWFGAVSNRSYISAIFRLFSWAKSVRVFVCGFWLKSVMPWMLNFFCFLRWRRVSDVIPLNQQILTCFVNVWSSLK